ncbi:hypothetical protein J2T09_002762 [Neorhizobium huautlense]|uniref:Uncharacterized protein n=1 Tax=Neorhizobium huautlense TaxID=67774 RepID=A0ABT9PU53_9HYPH|nr:hypothetical protein [Neorhizobium huautlense]MDP9838002.1 hypothetical protein [Neorhizobium huautlense]
MRVWPVLRCGHGIHQAVAPGRYVSRNDALRGEILRFLSVTGFQAFQPPNWTDTPIAVRQIYRAKNLVTKLSCSCCIQDLKKPHSFVFLYALQLLHDAVADSRAIGMV